MRKPEEKKKRKKARKGKWTRPCCMIASQVCQLSLANSTYGKLRQHRTTAISRANKVRTRLKLPKLGVQFAKLGKLPILFIIDWQSECY